MPATQTVPRHRKQPDQRAEPERGRESRCRRSDNRSERRWLRRNPDLSWLSQSIARARGGAYWGTAVGLAGPRITAWTTQLATGCPAELAAHICRVFQPEWNAPSTAISPAQRRIDWYLRAVAAQAILGRFAACLDAARLAAARGLPEIGLPTEQGFCPDLLGAMARTMQGRCLDARSATAPPEFYDLIYNEVVARSGSTESFSRVVARIKRHLPEFLEMIRVERASGKAQKMPNG